MSRLIDADALKEQFREGAYTVKGIREEIDNAPSVEPQKIVIIPPELIEKLAMCVVDIVGNIDWEKAIEAYKARPQGEWDYEKVAFYGVCSNCGVTVTSNLAEMFLYEEIREFPHAINFCPNCGAQMRGGRA